MLRPRHARSLTLGSLAVATALTLAGCGGSSGKATGVANTVGPSTTAPVTSVIPTTTIMPTCAGLPEPAAISAAVGVPMAAGQVNGSGSCQYLGVNDQSKSVTLSKFTDPADQANWNDLQASLGAPAPYADAALPGALAGNDGSLYLTSNGSIYVALVNVTGGAAKDQIPTAAKLLAAWLAG